MTIEAVLSINPVVTEVTLQLGSATVQAVVESAQVGVLASAPSLVIESGPQGPPGTSEISFSMPGALLTGLGIMRWYVSENASITKAIVSVSTAPTGADLVFDVNKNGVSVYADPADRPKILAGQNFSVISLSPAVSVEEGDYLTVDIDQTGSTESGANAVLRLTLSQE